MNRPPPRSIADLAREAERAFSLGVKLIVPFIAIMLAVVGTVVWIEYRLQRAEINDGHVEHGQILARAMAADFADPEDSGHLNKPADLAEHIEKVMSLYPAVLRANIYVPREDGVVTAASSDPSLVGRPAEPHDTRPLRTGLTDIKETRLGDEKALEVNAPVQIDGATAASLGLYVSLKKRDAALQALALRLTVAPALAVVATCGVVWLALRILVLRRLRRMVRAGERLAQGDMTSRVPGRWDSPGRDEMATAIYQFNNMAESMQLLTEKLKQMGLTDGLTEIHNRRFFNEMLPQELARSRRLSTPAALLMLDIDRFKRFNDRFGHPAGDKALRIIARTLARYLRAMDTVSRYGGEEFAVVLPEAHRESALATAERLRSAVESATLGIAAKDERLTVSVGVATYPADADDAAGLVMAADTALYAAKRAGRNTVRTAAKVDYTPVDG